jgi:hypothetical protein
LSLALPAAVGGHERQGSKGGRRRSKRGVAGAGSTSGGGGSSSGSGGIVAGGGGGGGCGAATGNLPAAAAFLRLNLAREACAAGSTAAGRFTGGDRGEIGSGGDGDGGIREDHGCRAFCPALYMLLLVHSYDLHLYRGRPCLQKQWLPQERHVHFTRPWLQIDTPPHSRHRTRRRPCGQMDAPPHSRHSHRRLPWVQKAVLGLFCRLVSASFPWAQAAATGGLAGS